MGCTVLTPDACHACYVVAPGGYLPSLYWTSPHYYGAPDSIRSCSAAVTEGIIVSDLFLRGHGASMHGGNEGKHASTGQVNIVHESLCNQFTGYISGNWGYSSDNSGCAIQD